MFKLLLNLRAVFCILIVFSSICLATETRRVESSKRKDVNSRRIHINPNKEVKFYGKIIDQFGEPVRNAHVSIILRYVDKEKGASKKPEFAISDSNGLFMFSGKGHRLKIEDIKKRGYEFLREDEEEAIVFHYTERIGGEYASKAFVPDVNNPVVFNMRKKGEPAYLFRNELRFFFKYDEVREEGIGLLNRRNTPITDSRQKEDIEFLDLNLKYRRNGSNYELLISSNDSHGGVILSKDRIFTAPESGYLPEVFIEIPVTDKYLKEKKYLYIKSRDGQMYSRVELRLGSNPEVLAVKMDCYSNESGSRNLEYDEFYQRDCDRENLQSKNKI